MLAKNFASRPAAHALAAAALVLAGCTSLAPPYAAPVLPVAPRYALDAAATNTSDASASERPAWRSYFADPQLQTLLAQAPSPNPQLPTTTLREPLPPPRPCSADPRCRPSSAPSALQAPGPARSTHNAVA